MNKLCVLSRAKIGDFETKKFFKAELHVRCKTFLPTSVSITDIKYDTKETANLSAPGKY